MTRWLEGIVFWMLALIAIIYLGVRFTIWIAALVARWIFSPGSILE
jgi:hypothetical protein